MNFLEMPEWVFHCLYKVEESLETKLFSTKVKAPNYLEASKAFMADLLLQCPDFECLSKLKVAVNDGTSGEN